MSVDISPDALQRIDARLRGAALAGVECCGIAADMLEAHAARVAELEAVKAQARNRALEWAAQLCHEPVNCGCAPCRGHAEAVAWLESAGDAIRAGKVQP
jgi:hypothetical protein